MAQPDLDSRGRGTTCHHIFKRNRSKEWKSEKQDCTKKFTVSRSDGKHEEGRKHYDCEYFVLDLTHDKYAPKALMAYYIACKKEYPVLAKDLKKILDKIY